jgi:hypothetical protein
VLSKTAFRSQQLHAQHKVNPIVSTQPNEKGMLAFFSESVFVTDASGISKGEG